MRLPAFSASMNGYTLGAPGDAGLDGLIRLDALGLDVVYVQAKRYTDRHVGRPDIQAFVGALHGAQASRGVFITTSRFSSEARDYADRVNARLVLIDGPELAALMNTTAALSSKRHLSSSKLTRTSSRMNDDCGFHL
jgi:restriction endonuclease Mrr